MSENSTIEELEKRLKELESRFLGTPPPLLFPPGRVTSRIRATVHKLQNFWKGWVEMAQAGGSSKLPAAKLP